MIKKLGSAIAFVIVVWACYFFYTEFQKSYDQLQFSSKSFSWTYAVLSLIFLTLGYLANTWAWVFSLEALSRKRIDPGQGFAILNISALGKYIPGKLWSYGLQLPWFHALGFSSATVMYNNLLNLGSSLNTSFLIGLSYLVYSGTIMSRSLSLTMLSILLAGNFFFVFRERQFLAAVVRVANRLTSRNFVPIWSSRRTIVFLQLIYIFSSCLFGLGVWFLCFAFGYPQEWSVFPTIVSAFALADAIGFMVLIVPGGIGVREGVMYSVLGASGATNLAVFIPVAARLFTMISEAVLVFFSFIIMRKKKSLNHQSNVPSNNPGFMGVDNRFEKAKKIELVLKDFAGSEIENMAVLDLGVGNGAIAAYFSLRNTVTASDVIDQRDDLFKVDAVKFSLISGVELPFKNNSFDVVIVNHVLSYVPDKKKFISECFRVLRPSGMVYIATPNRIYPFEPHYKVPFLHYLPNPLFNISMKIIGCFRENVYLISVFSLKNLLKNENFQVSDYTVRIIKDGQKFGMSSTSLKWFPSFLGFISPTVVVVAKKNDLSFNQK